MLLNEGFSRFEKNYLWFVLGLLVFAFFYQLGIYPLFLEEPRRGLIALEMMQRDNYWVPTQTGDLYFRKPPFYNWVLIASYKLFGETEFATRFFSVLSHLLLGLLTYVFSKKYLGNMLAVLISLSYLVSLDILVYFSTLGEIDLFYALITGWSLFLIFHYGESKKYYKLFVFVYILTAIGFLTKGLSALPYTAISLLVYFIANRDFKRLMSLPHITGIASFALLLAGYFFMFNQYEDVSSWWTTLYTESADKASGGGVVKWLKHIASFPLDTAKNLLPAAFIIPLMFSRKQWKQVRQNKFVWYALLIFVFNFLIYWVSTEGRSRYIYPLFPMACIVFLAIYQQSEVRWKTIYLNAVVWFILVVLLLAFGALPFIAGLEVVDGVWIISVVCLTLMALLMGIHVKTKIRPYLIILGALVVLRLGFSAVIPQTREKSTGAAEDKVRGIEMAEITEGRSLFRYGDVRMSLTIVFYLERDREQPLYQTKETTGDYYFVYPKDLSDFKESVEVIRQFNYGEQEILLIKNF